MVKVEKSESKYINITLVTLGWSSLCQTATSCVKAALREAISASERGPCSPQSRSLTESKNYLALESAGEHEFMAYL